METEEEGTLSDASTDGVFSDAPKHISDDNNNTIPNLNDTRPLAKSAKSTAKPRSLRLRLQSVSQLKKIMYSSNTLKVQKYTYTKTSSTSSIRKQKNNEFSRRSKNKKTISV
jgi:hypothetical protein